MKLDKFIAFVVKTAHDHNPESQEVRFQVSVDMDMVVHAAKITISGETLPEIGVQMGQEPYGLDFSIRIAGKG